MIQFDAIAGAIQSLSHDEKLRLRSLLDDKLSPVVVAPSNGVSPKSSLIGLFSSVPEMLDEIVESAYEQRSRPLRMDE